LSGAEGEVTGPAHTGVAKLARRDRQDAKVRRIDGHLHSFSRNTRTKFSHAIFRSDPH
jgi:hypothetical protein